MKNYILNKQALILMLILLNSLTLVGQVDCNDPINTCSRNGWQLPVRGTVKILFVFAEWSDCQGANYSTNWPAGQMPSDKDQWLDYQISPNPTTNCTKYYKDISLGEYNVIGDYYNQLIQVPCHSNEQAVINQLNNVWQPNSNGDYVTAHGLKLSDFDDYGSGAGKYKAPGNPDSYIDAVVVIWRNNSSYNCSQGKGVGNFMDPSFIQKVPLKNKFVNLYGAWNGCPEDLEKMFLKNEYFHAMYGSNNFHTGSGAAPGTFSWPVGSYSTTGQSESASKTVCGWDRWFLDYKGIKQNVISALNSSGTETPSDLTISNSPNESIFILRDFVSKGDVIRLKLPHLNWTQDGDIKNQYLWIENHQKVSSIDVNKNPCNPWHKGLYAYIQVGKDVITGDNLYGYDNCIHKPNELNDHLFPLSAEGNFDFYYDYANQASSIENCIWGNKYTVYGKIFPDGTSLPNPFTGFSDLYGKFDSNKDGVINELDADSQQKGYIKGIKKYLSSPGSETTYLSKWGDSLDAYFNVGQKIYIGSNPAPVPVYTRCEGVDFLYSFENRTIFLNNISIEILNTDYFGDGTNAYKVRVKWDDYQVNDNTRWCGYIRLKNDVNDPLHRPNQISIAPQKTITIDLGKSPTRRDNGILQGDGTYLFTDPSALFLDNGTITTLQNNSILQVLRGSSLIIKSGATLNLNANSKIIIDPTSHLCIDNIADIHFLDPTASITINGQTYLGSLATYTPGNGSFVNSVLPTGTTYWNSISVSGSATIANPGVTLLKATNYIEFGPKTNLNPSTGSNLLATIQNQSYSNDCSNSSNYDNLTIPINVSCNYGLSGIDITLGGDDDHEDDEHHTSLIPEIFEANRFNIYPNPSLGLLKIFVKENWDISNVIIYNAMGEKIYEFENLNKNNIELNLNELNEGIYYVKVSSNSYVEVHKVIKRN